jgi:hypothetical protein
MMNVTVCTHPQRCAGMEAAHSDMAAQLCAAWVEVAQLKAQLVQAQAAAVEWQDAYNGAVEGKAFYEQAFSEATRKAVRA